MVVDGEGNQVMIAKFVKQAEIEESKIQKIYVQQTSPKKTGFAGELELVIYDEAIQERVKQKLGKEVDVKILL